MEKYYLSKEKIKELKGIINFYINPNKFEVFKRIIDLVKPFSTGFPDTIVRNRELFYRYINNEILVNHPDIYYEMNRLNRSTRMRKIEEINELVKKFIDENYKDEWEFLCVFDLIQFNQSITDFCLKNNIQYFGIHSIINSESVDNFLEQFEKKNMDPELLKRNEIIKKNVDSLFQGIPYKRWEYAIIEYLKTGEEHKLNNILNQNE